MYWTKCGCWQLCRTSLYPSSWARTQVKSYNPNQNKGLFLCFPDNFDFQKRSTPKTTSQVNGSYALSVCYPCWLHRVVKIQFSNMCVFWKKGKQGLTGQAKYFLVQSCFKNKQNPAPPLIHSSLPQGMHRMLLFIHIHCWIKPHVAFFLMHSSKLALPEGTLQFRQHEHTLFPPSGS